jgi:ComF family protein
MLAIANALVATLIAPTCVCCNRPLDDTLHGAVCAACWRSIPAPAHPLCQTCGDTLHTWRTEPHDPLCARCRRRARVISRGRSVAAYEGTLRDIVHALKYSRRRSVARGLALRMAAVGAEVLDGAHCVVPVPLHWTRRYKRGFNQSAELARYLHKPVVYALRRRRRTATQTDLPEGRRHDNVRGAFVLRWRADVHGRIVVLVDDVSTTGATLDACASVLLEGGALEVRALTAARAAARLP